jgi:hypothetical protein
MWFYAPQKWYEVPGFLWRAWRVGRADGRRRAGATEAPSRPATMPARNRRADYAEAVDAIRRHVERMRPQKCCKGAVMVAGGKRHDVCSDDCPWAELDLLIANASVDA